MGLVAENKVDLLFTDILMPGKSGIELARGVKQRHPEIKIMFMTGYYPLAAEAQTLGKSLLKPVRPMQLVEELTRLLAA